MGAKQVGAQYTPLPKDFQAQRSSIWDYIGKNIGSMLPGYGGDLAAPKQLGQSGDLISKMLSGSGTGIGGMVMPKGWDTLGGTVSNDPTYQANLARAKMGIGTGVDQALQSAFGTGTSTQGTGMMRTAGDIGARGMTEFGAGEMERQRQALEAAKTRQLGMAGMEMQEATNRANLGMGYSSAVQASQQPAYEEWKRRQYETSPLFGAINAWGSQYPQQPQKPDIMESPLMGFFKSLVGAGGQVAGAAAGNPSK